MQKTFLTAAALLLATPVLADGPHVYTFDGSYDEATFSVEEAIIGEGLVIDHVSRTSDMLDRTGADVGSEVKLFDNAQIYTFCSAVVSRRVMEADPVNIAYCPYGIYVAERDGAVTIGFRDYPEGVMDQVEALLDSIVREAGGAM